MVKRNTLLGIGVISVIVILIGVFSIYKANIDDEGRQAFEFGHDLKSIQDQVLKRQVEFSTKLKQFEDGKISKEEFSKISENHIERLDNLIKKYDNLNPPEDFEPAVNLFKLSTVAQFQSDKEYIQWLRTGNETHKIRSDDLLQEAFEYEMAALSKYKQAQNNNSNDS